jgi:methionyl-tRNA synthetase
VIWELVDELNGYITDQAPWTLAKDPADRDRLAAVLATAVYGLGVLAVLLAPVLPKATTRLWEALGGEGAVDAQRIDTAATVAVGTSVTPLETSLFPRIETEEVAPA